MAVKLPSARNVTGAVDPSIARDPGLQVSPVAFGSAAGQGMTDVGQGLDQASDAAVQVWDRQSTVAAARELKSFRQAADEELTRLENEDDLSIEQVKAGYGEFLNNRMQQIVQNFAGRPALTAQLEEKLLDTYDRYTAFAGEKAATISRQHILQEIKDEHSSIFQKAYDDPSRLPEVKQEIDDSIDFYTNGLTIEQEMEIRAQQKASAVEFTAEGRIEVGQYDEARSIIRRNASDLPEETQLSMLRRIDRGQFAREEMQQKIAIATATERARSDAKREYMSQLFSDLGIAGELSGGVTLGATEASTGETGGATKAKIFSDASEPSQDAQSVARLYEASKRLALAGETELANSMLRQAQFLAENSPEMKKQQELDKPISEDLARELQFPIGTTMRDATGIVPRSPEAQARLQATATAQGREQVKAEETLSFIDEATAIVDDLQEEIKLDPSIIGATGSLRSTGQTAIQVLDDLGFNDLVESAFDLALSETDLSIDEASSMFDNPALSTLDMIENSLGLIWARMQVPDQRLPVDVIQRSINEMQLTGLRGQEQVAARLQFLEKRFAQKRKGINKRFGLGSEEPEPKKEVPVPYMIDPDGNLVPEKGAG